MVFISFPATGHVNPTLPLAAELVRRMPVTYFVHEKVRDVVVATGASWQPLPLPQRLTEEQLTKYVSPETAKEDYEFPITVLPFTVSCAPKLIEELRALTPPPSVILYDTYLPLGVVVAKELGLPCVGIVTITGPGVIQVAPDVLAKRESGPVAAKARQELIELYGLDVFAFGTFYEFYSPDQNIVCTCKSLYCGPRSPMQLARFGNFPFECVGPLLNPQIQRLCHADIPDQPVLLPEAT